MDNSLGNSPFWISDRIGYIGKHDSANVPYGGTRRLGYMFITTTMSKRSLNLHRHWLLVGVVFLPAASVLIAAPPPNDPMFGEQWPVHNSGQLVNGEFGLPGADIDLLSAWDIHRGSRPVIVAVVGGGVTEHPEFVDRLLPGHATVGDPRDWSDTCGSKGTFIAGIIAAAAGNGAGIAGIQDRVRILPVRVLDGCAVDNLNLVAGMEWAVAEGAEIIVVPIARSNGSSVLEAAVQAAQAAGALVIAPSGNTGEGLLRYPAAYDECLAVSSTTPTDQRAPLSNYGPHVDLAAPGDHVVSTGDQNDYLTSSDPLTVALAHVAGVAALVLSYSPGLSQSELRQVLLDSADDLGLPGRDDEFGAGRVNARRALELAPLPGLRIVPLDGLPPFVPPGRVVSVNVQIDEAGETLVSGQAVLHYRSGSGGFQTAPLVDLGGGQFRADLPPQACGAPIEAYVSVMGSGGTTVTEPLAAPIDVWTSTARFDSLLFEDDFETHQGWTVITIDPATTHGVWQRGDPKSMLVNVPADPPFDYTVPPGTQCFFTEAHTGGSVGTNDVDGGPVRLLSPVIELHSDDAEIRYARYFHSTGGTPDLLTVEFSRDGGNTWTLVESAAHEPVWVPRAFRLSDFSGVGGQLLRLRFSTSDDSGTAGATASLTEAAIDDVSVRALSCTPAGGDYDLDGYVGLSDQAGLADCMLGPVFPYGNMACQRVDFDNNDRVDLRDAQAFAEAFDPP